MPPVAVADDGTLNYYYMTNNSSISTDDFTGVLQNDQTGHGDVSTGPMIAELMSAPTVGNFNTSGSLAADGKFSYKAPAGFIGNATFTYRIKQNLDGTDYYSNTVSVSFEIVANFTATSGVGITVANPDPGLHPWWHFHHDGQDTGDSPGAGDLADVVSWTVTPGAAIQGSVIVITSGGVTRALMGDSGGVLHALDAGTGVEAWNKYLDAGSFLYGQAPTLGTNSGNGITPLGVLYVSSYDGRLYALNANTGATLWMLNYIAPTHFYASPLVVPSIMNGISGGLGIVAIGTDEWQTPSGTGKSLGSIRAYNPDGTEFWRTLLTGRVMYGPTYDSLNGNIYVACEPGPNESGGHIYAIDPTTGRVKDKVDLVYAPTAPTTYQALTGGAGYVFIPNGRNVTRVETIAAGFGNAIDILSAGNNTVHTAVTLIPGSTDFVFGNDAGNLVRYTTSVTTVWSITVAGPIKNSPGYRNGRLYFGTLGSPGHFYAIDAATGASLLDYTFIDTGVSFDISSLGIDGVGDVYICSTSGKVFKFS